jgi:uncharacterized membrane protein YhaH (DUF805 family)
MELFTSFNGRISRKGFWLGFLAMVAVAVVAGLVMLQISPVAAVGMNAAASDGIMVMLVQLAMAVVITYFWSAIIVKRLHDRGKSAMPWAIVFMAPGILLQIMSIFKIGYSAEELAGTQIMIPGIGATVVTLVTVAVGLWMIVELGFLKGSPGDNAYGPSPVGETPATQAV